MKLFILPLLTILTFWQVQVPPAEPSDGLRNVKQDAFKVGEKLHYDIRYGPIRAGEAVIEVAGSADKHGRPAFHVVGTGHSVGMAKWFFPAEDRYESYIDQRAIIPWEFIRDVDEDGHIIKRHLIFNQRAHTVTDRLAPEKGTFEVPRFSQDMLSAFYYARTAQTSGLEPGDHIDFNMFLDYENLPFYLKLLRRENLETDFGTIPCLVLRPTVQTGRVFNDKQAMTIWVSDDANKIPLLIQSDLLIGSVKVELTKAEGLRHASALTQ